MVDFETILKNCRIFEGMSTVKWKILPHYS